MQRRIYLNGKMELVVLKIKESVMQVDFFLKLQERIFNWQVCQ